MMYICFNCGKVFDEEESGTRYESRGEFWGMPCSEPMMCCPYCGSDEFDEC